MTKVTSQNNGSPQITRVLRDREEQADMVDNLQSGSAACIPLPQGNDSPKIDTGLREVSGDCSAFQSYCGVRASFGRRAVWGSAPERRTHFWWRRTCGDCCSELSTSSRYPCTQPRHPSFRSQLGPGGYGGSSRARWAHGKEGAD
jgi:hypothetical protein